MSGESPEKARERMRRYRIAHPGKYNEWLDKNRKKVNAQRRHRYATDPEYRAKRHAWARAYKSANPEKARRAVNRWFASHKEEVRKIQSEYMRKRRQCDIGFRLRRVLRTRMYRAFVGIVKKSFSTEELTGCSMEFLQKHLKSLWQPGMSWKNYGYRGWHIDHIRPCASFDLTDIEQQKKCFHFTNLQPMWAEENMQKGARLPCAV